MSEEASDSENADARSAHGLTGEEGHELIAAAERSRAADRDLASALHRPQPAGQAATAGFLHDLALRVPPAPGAERELVEAAQAGDAAARARLVEVFMPLIASAARVYRDSARVERIDLLQEGVVGLLRALERYDPARGVPFWGYATFWVRHAMQQLVTEVTRPFVLSDRALRQLARVKDAHRRALQDTGREPDLARLAALTGLTEEQVRGLLAADRVPRSMEEEVVGDDGSLGTFGELVSDPLAEGEYERVLNAVETEQLQALLSGLSEREREILRARYGLSGPERTLREIAGDLGLSAERVRQLEERALGKLAAAAGARG